MKHADRNSRTRISGMLLGLVLLSLPCSHAVAADKKDKQERIAQFRLQQMQQKFEQEKAALEQENTALKEQLEKDKAMLATTGEALAKQRQEMKKLKAEYSENETQMASCQREAESARVAARSELAASQQKLAETVQNLRQSEALNKQLNGEKSRLEIALAEQKAEVHSCQAKNANLINMFKEMTNKYEKAELKGVEQFTGLKGVEIENSFQDARDQAETQLYKPRK